MVGSPGDVSEEANFAINEIHKWNSLHTNTHEIALVPIHWTTSSFPTMEKEGQKALNSQLVDKSDLMVCIFGARLGTPTSTHISGTVEEIEKHLEAKKDVLLFIKKFVNPDDIEQLTKLKDYVRSISDKCLYQQFDDFPNFQKIFPEKFNLYIESNLLVKKKAQSLTEHNPSYSDEEKQIMRNWCSGNYDTFTKYSFTNGTAIYSFGNHRINTNTPREKAQLDDFLSRLENDNFITRDKYTNQGNWTYKLNLSAFNYFAS